MGNKFSAFEKSRSKMEKEGIAPSAISAFESTFKMLASGESGMIPESTISPVPDLVKSDELSIKPDTTLLGKTVVLKLNGGLGTGMGLDKAKSLLKVKDDQTFLDFIAKQVISMRKKHGFPGMSRLLGVVTNMTGRRHSLFASTFSVDSEIHAHELLLHVRGHIGLFESQVSQACGRRRFGNVAKQKVPKLDAETLEPAVCPSNPSNEWCPPGHGDLYAALVGSGRLDELLAAGYKYMFVSNSDNLGASLDMGILTYFAQQDLPFMMECCERTENDKKGGHLAVRNKDKQLILRESAMCAEEDEDAFKDISKHRFFNTNNLWIRLDRLKETIDKSGGFIPLPMIKNKKTVDPKDDTSQKVIQLETAMGAAIECFEGASAIVVPRTRFAPVKKCSDLLLLRSDAYLIIDDKPVLNPACKGVAPVMNLDSKVYKLVGALEEATAGGIPSLVKCKKLTLKGKVTMTKKTTFVGEVSIINSTGEVKALPSGKVTGTIEY